MNRVYKILLLVGLVFCVAASVEVRKGLIVYLDGMSSSGVDRVGDVLKRLNCFTYLSPEEYAKKHDEPIYKSAVLVFKEAVTRAKQGEYVLLDSFTVKPLFEEARSQFYDIVKIGVWCSLLCMQKRYDEKTGVEGSHKKSFLRQEYEARYDEKSPGQIRADNGKYYYNSENIMRYDLFLDSEIRVPEELANDILNFLRLTKNKKVAKKKEEVPAETKKVETPTEKI